MGIWHYLLNVSLGNLSGLHCLAEQRTVLLFYFILFCATGYQTQSPVRVSQVLYHGTNLDLSEPF